MSSMEWTTADVPDCSGHRVIVTGANSGIGKEATRLFAENGADIVMACRSVARGRAAADDLRNDGIEGDLSVRELDLADLDSVESFADGVLSDDDNLHVLCNNAGVMAIPRSETSDGFETQFGVNHLGHFALTGHLLDRLIETDGETRIVTQSSGVHERGSIDFDDLHHEAEYGKWDAYAQSKLANVLFAYELDRRLDRAGVPSVTSVACHPGYADTNLQRRGPEQAGATVRLWLMRLVNAVVAQPASRGALPLVYAATADRIEGGEYVGPGGFMNMRGYPEPQQSSDNSYDEDLARRLWDVSESLTGVEYELETGATV
ncbi:MAG: NAD(P)-dependent dehydrogenase (short-subunit alcohol dehydrogenase family) [Halobacteriales archaeon]|jgi:NAD(P)-dependent dehydrogenase (short-subunit alcohol dehydrogenase family)